MNNNYKNKLSVLLVSDFFYPKLGGVEVHIYQLATSLIRLGLKIMNCWLNLVTKNRKKKMFLCLIKN